MDSEDALASGDRRGERASLLASRSTRESAEEGQPREEGVTMREEDGSVYGWRRAVGTRAGRVRVIIPLEKLSMKTQTKKAKTFHSTKVTKLMDFFGFLIEHQKLQTSAKTEASDLREINSRFRS